MTKVSRGAGALSLAAALIAALTSCSASSADTGASKGAPEIQTVMNGAHYRCDKPNADKMTSVTVTALPIVSNGAIYAGIDQGFFKKNGLDVKINTVADVPSTIAAVQGGTTDFAFTGTIATFQAIDRGIPLTIVAPFAGIEPGYWDKMKAGVQGYTREITALLVAPNSDIKDPGDLNGKNVAVVDAQGQGELTTRYVIKAHGGDPSTVHFVVMSYADAVNALEAGQVDAAYSAEPFILPAEAKGYRIISWPGVETFHEGPTSAMVSSNNFVLKNPETVARFNCAIRESTAFANKNPDVIRATTAREQKVDPAKLANATVPYFYSTVDFAGLERFYKVTKSVGFVKKDIDLKSFVIPQAVTTK